jgi:hypothetical protein
MYAVDWNYIRYMIMNQPMPIEIGDIAEVIFFGNQLFLVEDIINNVCYGLFVNWKIGRGVFSLKSLKLSKKVNILCNDCNTRSNVYFHYLGNECLSCGGFNTGIIG